MGVSSTYILHQSKTQAVALSKKEIMDSESYQATFTEYNRQGQIKAMMSAKTIKQYQPSGTIVFEKPFILAYGNNRAPIHVRADKATANKSINKIIMSGSVVIHQLKTKKDPETTIQTSQLIVFPKKSQAITNKPVVITRPGIIIHSIGLTANLKTAQYQLHSNSHVIYQPTHK